MPISVAWAFTRERGWHVIEDLTSAIDMDRLVEQYDEAEAREASSNLDEALRCPDCGSGDLTVGCGSERHPWPAEAREVTR